MKINKLELDNFRAFENACLKLDGKSAVLFGVNGTGKSSVLKSINLLYANIINQIVNRKELKQSYVLGLEDIRFGKPQVSISAEFQLDGAGINYSRAMTRSNGQRTHNLKSLKQITEAFQGRYLSDEIQDNMPIFVNYGTNRLVLDIPLRIRTHHEFDIYSAFEKAIENRIDFRTFFEWFRNQEDDENARKVESRNLKYVDRSLLAVRNAALAMLEGCTNLRVSRNPRLEMKVDKNGMGLNVGQLSDGEKCTMALFGDLARRLAIANPKMENPLLGEGVVLIDEVELHMHPSWQRSVLRKLEETFPNVQFIITTHSPIVLSEVDDGFKVFVLTSNGKTNAVTERTRMDGFDANYILEEFMNTKSMNVNTEHLIDSIYEDVYAKKYSDAEEKIQQLVLLVGENNKDVIEARMLIRKGRV